MKRAVSGWLALGTIAVVGASGFLIACNGLLGIGVASQEAEDAGAAEAGVPVGLTCEYYCDQMDKNCNWNHPFGEYQTVGTCVSMCKSIGWDQGNGIGASNDDTLGCRIFYAQQAANDAAKNCRFAGLLGGGQCGTSACEDFCTADIAFCNSPAVNTPAYQTQTECLADCKGVDAGIDGGDGGTPGYPYVNEDAGELFNIETGNTLNCRLWHLNAAYQPMVATFHCPHTELRSSKCK